jgi:hypothetical protein
MACSDVVAQTIEKRYAKLAELDSNMTTLTGYNSLFGVFGSFEVDWERVRKLSFFRAMISGLGINTLKNPLSL